MGIVCHTVIVIEQTSSKERAKEVGWEGDACKGAREGALRWEEHQVWEDLQEEGRLRVQGQRSSKGAGGRAREEPIRVYQEKDERKEVEAGTTENSFRFLWEWGNEGVSGRGHGDKGGVLFA